MRVSYIYLTLNVYRHILLTDATQYFALFARSQYMSMQVALIVAELVTAAVLGIMTYRVITGLEGRMAERLNGYYGEQGGDLLFTNSLNYAQFKVRFSNSLV